MFERTKLDISVGETDVSLLDLFKGSDVPYKVVIEDEHSGDSRNSGMPVSAVDEEHTGGSGGEGEKEQAEGGGIGKAKTTRRMGGVEFGQTVRSLKP